MPAPKEAGLRNVPLLAICTQSGAARLYCGAPSILCSQGHAAAEYDAYVKKTSSQENSYLTRNAWGLKGNAPQVDCRGVCPPLEGLMPDLKATKNS